MPNALAWLGGMAPSGLPKRVALTDIAVGMGK